MAFAVDVPGPPRNLRDTGVQASTIEICFDVPESDGGSPITGYIIERQQTNRCPDKLSIIQFPVCCCMYSAVNVFVHSSRWSRVNKQSTLDLTYSVDVYEGLQYYIRVSAENEAGQGKPCEPIGPITASAPIGKFLSVEI